MNQYFVRFTYAYLRKGVTTFTPEKETYKTVFMEKFDEIELKKQLKDLVESTMRDIHTFLYIKDILTINKL